VTKHGQAVSSAHKGVYIAVTDQTIGGLRDTSISNLPRLAYAKLRRARKDYALKISSA
jgi:hypothetical protein